jgi:response regulator RpfG family c-di-GMP phosphodiesterase
MEKKVLIVDDNLEMRQLLATGLKKLGYPSHGAPNGKIALQEARENKYALILLDVEMPIMDGFAFLKAFRDEHGYDTDTNIMMVTAHRDRETVEKAIKYRACDFIVKPFQIAQFLHKVSRWINVGVEKSWGRLKPEHENILRLTMTTLDRTWDGVIENKPIQYSEFLEISGMITESAAQKDAKGLLDAVKDHDAYTFVHSLRTGIFLSMFAMEHFKFSKDEAQTITSGGVLHDIGKARTPLTVLNKGGGFEPEEWLVMQEHVRHTVDILHASENIPEPVIEIAWCHHEKLDGSGYPRHLKGDEIGPLARMAAIADAYVALTDRRVYKPAFSHEKTFGILEGATKHFDNDLVKDFKKVIQNYFPGIEK